MSLPTLDAFRTSTTWPNNSYVEHPDFHDLYVRRSKRFLGGCVRDALDIARVIAEKPGRGAFTRLVEHLLKEGVTIYVESVLTPRFEKKLLAMGFSPSETTPHCYYKLPR
jgi:hypothetical protein